MAANKFISSLMSQYILKRGKAPDSHLMSLLRKGGGLVVAGRVGAAKRHVDNGRIRGEVQAQGHQRGLFGFAGCFLRDG